jgi:DNA modification methylase
MQNSPAGRRAEKLRGLVIEHLAPSALKPYSNNPRSHTKKQIRQIATSIETFGWTNPVLIDADDGVIAGHGRLEAAKLLGFISVPVVRIEGMTEAQKRAYILADNKLAENAGWDRELLALELRGLLEMDLDFEVTATGFEMAEIDLLVGGLGEDPDEADHIPALDPEMKPITKPGDLWQLGRHRLLCADATKSESFAHLMGGELAELVFTDPPYNVPIDGHVCGHGAAKHRDFAMASGEMTEPEFIAFLENVLGLAATHSRDGAIAFVCMDWRHLFELLTAGRRVFSELKNLCVWAKSNGGMGSLYRSQHELVAVFKKGTKPHVNNVKLGRYGRHRTNVWSYPGMSSFGADRDETLRLHPTVKPIALVEDAILDCSKRAGIVLDAFVGAGTTLIAAERTGRRGFGLELDPLYVDVALRRFRQTTGTEPRHGQSGRSLCKQFDLPWEYPGF